MSNKAWDVVVVETVAATSGDDASVAGHLQIDAESSTKFLKGKGIPARAITGWKNEAFTAGVAHAVDIEYTGTTLAADHEYTVTVKLADDPSKSWSFGVIFKTAPANVPAIVNALVAKINKATQAPFTASLVDTDDLLITADSVATGKLLVSDSEGGTVTGDGTGSSTAFVAAVGTEADVIAEGGTPVAANEYDKLSIYWNRPVRHNGVSGAIVGVATKSVIFLDDVANAATLRGTLEDHLDGTTATIWQGVTA